MAIVEREMRKFFRSPVLMIMSMMLPLVQLVILGNAFGGKIRGAKVAVVDYDHGPRTEGARGIRFDRGKYRNVYDSQLRR
jgi:ABC-2 type transport system permease protein